MLNRINRFVRNIESKYDCDENNLIIETAVYVPERVASRTNIPWKTIFSHISSYIPEDLGIRSLDSIEVGTIDDEAKRLFSLSYNDGHKQKVLSTYISVDKITGIEFTVDDSLSNILSSTAKIGTIISHQYGSENKNISAETTISNLVRSLSIDSLNLYLDENENTLCADLSYTANNTKNSISTNVINLSAYKSTIEEDPVFWQAERTVRAVNSIELSSTVINSVDLSKGREQSYKWNENNNGVLSLYIPESDPSKSGELVLYLEEHPEDDPNKVFILSSANIKTLPTRRPWTLSNGIWKLEFDSIPGSTNWRYIQSTRYKFDD